MGKKKFILEGQFKLELGQGLNDLEVAYHTYGSLNSRKDNVIWVCHALTANSDVADWWAGLVGPGRLLDPDKYFIVCANILGSCYGTTGPLSVDPVTLKPYYGEFPFITIRDMVQAQIRLREKLGISQIFLGLGGSMGGSQLLEWAVIEPDVFQNLCLIATNAKESPWAIALHTAQRMAIEADQTWGEIHPQAGIQGLKAARAMGIPSYRNYKTFELTQSDDDPLKYDDFRASSYQYHQGEKLAGRFNAYSYYTLLKALDSHNLGRNRNGLEPALGSIEANVLIVGIKSDGLYPLEEQDYMARHIPNCEYVQIDSLYGHDGFLVETDQLNLLVPKIFQKKTKIKVIVN